MSISNREQSKKHYSLKPRSANSTRRRICRKNDRHSGNPGMLLIPLDIAFALRTPFNGIIAVIDTLDIILTNGKAVWLVDTNDGAALVRS